MNRSIPALSGLRGFAALWVFAYHAWGYAGHPYIGLDLAGFSLELTPLVALGGAGVTVFFVLSGFLLGTPYARWQAGQMARPDTGAFLLRRVARVFPAYYLQLAILLILMWLTGHAAELGSARLIGHLGMFFIPQPVGVVPLNLVWWTLPIEFCFYLVLPITAPLLKPNRWIWLAILSCGAMVCWRYIAMTLLVDASLPERVSVSYQLLGSYDMFGMGMVAAVLCSRHETALYALPSWIKDGLCITGLLLLAMATYWLAANRPLYWANNPIFFLWTPLLSIGTVCLIVSAASGGNLVTRTFANSFMLYAGLISYSFYLWHPTVLDWILPEIPYLKTGWQRFFAIALMAGSASLLVASVSYRLIERPVQRWVNPNSREH